MRACLLAPILSLFAIASHALPHPEAGTAAEEAGARSAASIPGGSAVEASRRQIDAAPPATGSWRRIELDGVSAQELLALTPSPLEEIPAVVADEGRTLHVFATDAAEAALHHLVRELERSAQIEILRLSYLDAAEILAALPPDTRAGSVTRSADPRALYLTGTEPERSRIREAVAAVDRPPVQIRYQVLVVQRQQSDGLAWSMNAENRTTEPGSRTRLLAGVGSLLALNFDILSVFGYEFALDLNAELSCDDARVLADTTLTGLSGERVSLENTDTYRYRDLEIDESTGEALPTGVTREITSGLVIHIQGEPAGDDAVDLSVEVRVSKRGNASAAGSSNPPPTSERIVQSVVRTRSGEPAVIGALTQADHTTSIKGVPLLARIRLLGWLFQHRRSSDEEVTLAVYIVPFRSDARLACASLPAADELLERFPDPEADQ